MDGGKEVKTSILCYAYAYLSFLDADFKKYENFFTKCNWPAAFINVGTGIFLAKGNAVEVNGQALVFVLHEFRETASLEGRKLSVTFMKYVCLMH